jgi:catechol 2,3-dioxygenase-like lactoylglutathione lyase family enzyme
MNFNKLIPELIVSNIEVSRQFYCNDLGFNLEYDRPENKFIFLSLGLIQIMLEERNSGWETAGLERPFGRGVNFQLEIDDAKALFKALQSKGHKFFREIQMNTYATKNGLKSQTEFLIQDPDGYLLRFFS